MHHATIVFGDLLETILKKLPADTIFQEYSNFGIDDSRELKTSQTRALRRDEKRYYVLRVQAITIEAQQALLKTFEEPTPGYYFTLVLPKGTELLPTLISRAEIVNGLESGVETGARDWLKAAPPKRLELIGKIVDESADPTEARVSALALVRAVAQILPARDEKALVDLNLAIRSLSRRAGLPRLVLEHLALVLPVC